MPSTKTANTFRKYHRLLGFFLAGVMVVYACSGVLPAFRAGLKFAAAGVIVAITVVMAS